MAHGDEGVIEPVLLQQVEGRLAIDVQVVVTYANDGDRADGATVTATAIAEDGTTLAPRTLEPASAPGAHVGVVEVPTAGTWRVRIEATAPAATFESQPVTVSEPVSTTTTSSSTTTTTAAAPGPVPPDDDDGAMWGGIAVVGALVAVGAAVGYRLARRRR